MAAKAADTRNREQGNEEGKMLVRCMEGTELEIAETPGGGTKDCDAAMFKAEVKLETMMKRTLSKYMGELEELRKEIKEERKTWTQERERERNKEENGIKRDWS